MLIKFRREIFRIKSQLFRLYSINIESRGANLTNHEILRVPDEDGERIIEQEWEQKNIRSDNSKSLRVAILGLPNVGKSTLVNRLVGRPVCGMSAKVHTTKEKLDAVYVEDNTQLIFVDTPGLVTNHDFKKFKLNISFKNDVSRCLETADVVGVVQDAAHPFTASTIDDRIKTCLNSMNPNIRSILILNKVDKLKKKKRLLEMVETLTGEAGWPGFADVFMISALQDDGVEDLRNYLLDTAENRDWEYDSGVVTDATPEKVAVETVRSRFMDALPKELPYLLEYKLEHFGVLPDDSMSIVIAVQCPSDRISKIVLGKQGMRVKIVALQAEQELSRTYRTTVRLKIAVKFSDSENSTPTHKKSAKRST